MKGKKITQNTIEIQQSHEYNKFHFSQFKFSTENEKKNIQHRFG